MSDAPKLPPLPTGLTRITVNLIPRAAQAMEYLIALGGDTQTNVVNKALQLYGFLEGEERAGRDVYIATPAERREGALTKIKVV